MRSDITPSATAWAFIAKLRWLIAEIKAMRRAQNHIKNGEQILGDKEFIKQFFVLTDKENLNGFSFFSFTSLSAFKFK